MAKARQSSLALLLATRLVLKQCKTKLRPIIHQVSAMPAEFNLEYYFVPIKHTDLFRPYYRPSKPYENFKFVNFERPAISLTFYNKHKYQISRDIRLESALVILKQQRNELFAKS